MNLGLLEYAIGAAVVAAMGVFAVVRARRQKRDAALLAQSQKDELHIPASLHPVIDAEVCIGSLSCITACPEGDILGIVDGSAALIAGASCIGHGRCAAECPVAAIKLVFGTAERGVDLPQVDGTFESSRPGVHIVGELGGMGLIRNAIVQGLEVAAYIKAGLGGQRAAVAPDTADVLDVLIVGAGPAGLAAAVGCRQHGLSFHVIDQGTVGGTIANYPRQKVVMTDRVELPGFGSFGQRFMSKEDLLAAWQKVMAKARIQVQEGVRMIGIEGEDGAFVVKTDRGDARARKVVLATGRRGSPRKLGVPGEELAKVSYRLIDPEQYKGARVLVVGGGDAAIEAAVMLAEETDAQVIISYRGPAFARCREANKRRIGELAAQRRLTLALGTEVVSIGARDVVLVGGGVEHRVPNDYVIVCAGGELPHDMLKKVGVQMERHFGHKAVAMPAIARPGVPAAAKGAAGAPATRTRWLGLTLFALGGLVVSTLAWMGRDYYSLPPAERVKSDLHESMRSAGSFGHGVGIVATAVMLSNFIYPVRKRWRALKTTGSIRSWLTWHMFVGFMSPLVIAFHAAFQSRNLLATATFWSLLIVVGAGVIGRFLFGLVPSGAGRATEHAALAGQWERMKSEVEPLVAATANPAALRGLLAPATTPIVKGASLLGTLARMPIDALRLRFGLWRLRRFFPDASRFLAFRRCLLDLHRLRLQSGFFGGLRRLMSAWRVVHVVLAVFLVVIMGVHIGVSLYLGFTWVFA